MAQNLKTGDKVKIIAGNHKGETAQIVEMDKKHGKAKLEGIGIRERHVAPNAVNPRGSKRTVHLGIDLSNLKKEGK